MKNKILVILFVLFLGFFSCLNIIIPDKEISYTERRKLSGFPNFELNSNRAEVDKLIAENKIDDAKALCGFFEKNGRVRTIKLRGVQSFGITISPKDIIKWQPQFEGFDFTKR